ncbi:hypothetical protein AUJ66_06925 [Candidatus Desantisbacteria bacterium CG1_02_38_46]|uniref:Uncharacterized protein TP-0789 domain-containing protein n=2 Tax=unclassified Candidatus Desantisiibacteriota TaxID=3106372 RepID=A0A2H9PCA6_9BACT|nr:MAG: hypothetical protein AUJ66_06925 [Candidatus Desantisbacteria bacterium CG1_02_38_46]PIZ15893.1 MAG: hypothetical protein COY51_04020 [Candidatus Desantisbacteria bacterium CG_4_10_14_0_8_um_filter_39_17]
MDIIKKVVALMVGIIIINSGILFAITAEEVLQKVDEALTYRNQVARLSMTLTDKRGIVQQREIELFQKEGGKRLIKFLKPADVKGVGFLSLPGDEMWLYMPALGKIRRIASHVKNQSFMGTDFSYEDMGGENFSKEYTTKDFKEEGENYTLEISSDKKDATYRKVKLVVSRETFIPAKIEFFDKAGRLLKIMANSLIEKIEGKWVAREIKMTNVQDGHVTVLKMLKISFDQNLSDDIFTQRNLQK